MPANWTVRSVEPNNGLVRVLLARWNTEHGQEEITHFHIVPNSFGQAFKVGDVRDALNFGLVSRAEGNGKDHA